MVRDPADGGAALRAAAERLGTYDWVVVTSPNGARRLLAALREVGGDARSFGRARLAAIGPGTADELAAGNLVADLVPPQFVAESLVAAFPDAARPAALAEDGDGGDAAEPTGPGDGWRQGRGRVLLARGRGRPATCCPRASGPRAGTSTSSRPTAPSPSRSTRPPRRRSRTRRS